MCIVSTDIEMRTVAEMYQKPARLDDYIYVGSRGRRRVEKATEVLILFLQCWPAYMLARYSHCPDLLVLGFLWLRLGTPSKRWALHGW